MCVMSHILSIDVGLDLWMFPLAGRKKAGRWLMTQLVTELVNHYMLKNTSPLMKTLAVAGIKPAAFWLQDAFCNLLATFTDSMLAPRWRGSCFRRPWQRRARRCGWTSAMCHSRWTRPATAPSSSSLWLSTTSLTTTAPSGPGQQKVDHGFNVKLAIWQVW